MAEERWGRARAPAARNAISNCCESNCLQHRMRTRHDHLVKLPCLRTRRRPQDSVVRLPSAKSRQVKGKAQPVLIASCSLRLHVGQDGAHHT